MNGHVIPWAGQLDSRLSHKGQLTVELQFFAWHIQGTSMNLPSMVSTPCLRHQCPIAQRLTFFPKSLLSWTSETCSGNAALLTNAVWASDFTMTVNYVALNRALKNIKSCWFTSALGIHRMGLQSAVFPIFFTSGQRTPMQVIWWSILIAVLHLTLFGSSALSNFTELTPEQIGKVYEQMTCKRRMLCRPEDCDLSAEFKPQRTINHFECHVDCLMHGTCCINFEEVCLNGTFAENPNQTEWSFVIPDQSNTDFFKRRVGLKIVSCELPVRSEFCLFGFKMPSSTPSWCNGRWCCSLWKWHIHILPTAHSGIY